MDPCKLVGLEKAQAVLGISMFQRLPVGRTIEGDGRFGDCFYEPLASEEGPELRVGVHGVTLQESQVESNNEYKFLKGLGRDARYRYRSEASSRDELDLVALSTKGVQVTIGLSMANTDERLILGKARSLVVPALARMEKVFPGSETPPRDEPPVPICSTVGEEAMREIYRSFWTPPEGVSITFIEAEFFGGPERIGSSPVGGGWVCRADFSEPHSNGAYHPHTAWWISKASPPSEPLPGSRPVRHLGASAFFRVVDEGWYFGDKSLVLSVFSKRGKYLEVQVLLEEGTDESMATSVARAIAEKILTKLP
jgi:hypothetical protein